MDDGTAAELTGDGMSGDGNSENGNKLLFAILSALITLNIAVTLGFGGWVATTVVELQKDVAVIKCQLSPECARATLGSRP